MLSWRKSIRLSRAVARLITVGVVLGRVSPAWGTDIYVDDNAPGDPAPGDPLISDPAEDGSLAHPFDAIQEAINAAGSADKVIIADGLYTGPGNRNIDFLGKNIQVGSANGPASCIIDCERSGRGFYFHSGEGGGSQLAGVTIRNGQANNGGGILIETASPVILNCIVTDNVVLGFGQGGGICCMMQSKPVIAYCTISNNMAYSAGGICFAESSPTISFCTIAHNEALFGAGVAGYRNSTPLKINYCSIEGNIARIQGGGIRGYDSTIEINNSIISDNFTDQVGGGVFSDLSTVTMANCTVVHNRAEQGAGLACDSITPGNVSDVTVANSIFWNEGEEIFNHYNSNISITYSNVAGGWAGEGNIDADPEFVSGEDYHLQAGSPGIDAGDSTAVPGNILTDFDGAERFWDDPGKPNTGKPGAGGEPVVDMGVYERNQPPRMALSKKELTFIASGANPAAQTLRLHNVGIDMLSWTIDNSSLWLSVDPALGDTTTAPAELTVSVDITGLAGGSYITEVMVNDPAAVNHPERFEVRLYVTREIRVPGDYVTIQAAIEAAVVGDTIVVADGVYTGAGNRDIDFLGKAITLRSENGPDSCVIDCGGSAATPHRGFWIHRGEGIDTVVEGFTIRNGYGPYEQLFSNLAAEAGGALYCDGSGATFKNCVIRDNFGGELGGGIYADLSCLQLIECEIINNRVDHLLGEGGGINGLSSEISLIDSLVRGHIEQGIVGSYGHFIITGSEISNNLSAGASAGGISLDNSELVMTGSRLVDNQAERHGGGVGLSFCDMIVSETLFANNTAVMSGGAIFGESSTMRVVNCIFAGNAAGTNGGGITNDTISSLELMNSTFSGNTATQGKALSCDSTGHDDPSTVVITNAILWDGGDEIWNGDGSAIMVTYSDVAGGGSGTGNINQDPCFVDAGAQDYHLQRDSPGIDAGTNTPAGGLPEIDFDGKVRAIDGDLDEAAVADMGAYEFGDIGPLIKLSSNRLEFYGNFGEANPAGRLLSIYNGGTQTLNWTIEPNAPCGWLTVEPASGRLQADDPNAYIVLNVDMSGLDKGDYRCDLIVGDPNAVNHPQAVTVILGVRGVLEVPGEYGTIQAAIEAAVDEVGRIVVEPGTYAERISFLGKDIELRSSDPEDDGVVAATIIDGGGGGTVVTFAGTEGAGCVLAGFTIRGGLSSSGGGINGNGTQATVRRCVIEGNQANNGGGISDVDGTISDCEISGNLATASGGGLRYCDGRIEHGLIVDNEAVFGGGLYSCNGEIINCTVADNRAGSTGGLRFCGGVQSNCIIWNNTGGQTAYGATPSYSCVEGGSVGDGNLTADPCFVDAGGRDYHLMSQAGRWDAVGTSWVKDAAHSPSIDGGDPNTEWRGELWPDGGRVNMGAYGGTAEASMSVSGVGNMADLNRDGAVNLADWGRLGEKWLMHKVLLQEDMNRDGVVDIKDWYIFRQHWLWR